MDAPRQPDGPPVRDGKAYSRIAHLAEDMVRPFVAIGAVLREAGLSAPEVAAMDLDKGLLLVEDLGDRAFGEELASGRTTQAELWRAAVDALIRLRSLPVPASLPLPDGASYTLPRRDRAAFEIEIELLLDWYWPAIKGAPAPPSVRAEFEALWTPVLDRLLALPGGWFLRDYHSPNLMWLPERQGIARVGILDFQDALNEHAAFDLVSLLQDARVTVPDALERELFGHYCAEIARQEPAFDPCGIRRRLRRLRRTAQHAAPRPLAAADAPRRQASVSPAYSAYLGISRPQPALCRAGAAGGVVRPPLPTRGAGCDNAAGIGLRTTRGLRGWPAQSRPRWCSAPGSARAWRLPPTACPSRWSSFTARPSSTMCSIAWPRRASRARSSTCTSRPTRSSGT